MAQLKNQVSAVEASAAAAEERAVAALAAQRQALREAAEAQQAQHEIALEEVAMMCLGGDCGVPCRGCKL